MRSFYKDKLEVRIYASRSEMGEAAARDIKRAIFDVISRKDTVNMIFAAAPSQNEVLAALAADEDIPWGSINAFHMDEYIGLSAAAPQGFGNFLRSHLFGLVNLKNVFYIDVTSEDAELECRRYSELLKKHPADIVVMGIGENGHIAFNDPPVADFQDERRVKTVTLDETCRNQQVHDGCFLTMDEVPRTAITLTVPALFSGEKLFCIVPAATKANAVRATLCENIGEACPATVLRLHDNATLYLDVDSSALIGEEL